MPRIKERTVPTSVWSAYGHRFMSDGNGPDEWGYWRESCLTCGAVYQLRAVPGDWTRGEYMAANGDEPHECSSRTDLAHGYPGERHDGETDHNCNCLACA